MTAQTATPHHANPQAAQATAALERLELLLEREDQALRRLDFATIDQLTADKETLERELSGHLRNIPPGVEIPTDIKARLDELRARVIVRAKENHNRLEATLRSVQGLLGALTGDGEAKTYGRNAQVSATPILTSTVG